MYIISLYYLYMRFSTHRIYRYILQHPHQPQRCSHLFKNLALWVKPLAVRFPAMTVLHLPCCRGDVPPQGWHYAGNIAFVIRSWAWTHIDA